MSDTQVVLQWLNGLPKRPTRVEMAHRYANILIDHWNTFDTASEWAPLNLAIVATWSDSGLRFIKTEAWKVAQRAIDARCRLAR